MVPDALADALEESFSREEVYAALAKLTPLFKIGATVEWTLEVDKVEDAILKDCCEGSTYFADMEDAVATKEITRGWAMSRHRAANNLEEKLNVVIPRY